MADITLVDITLHIDEDLSAEQRTKVEEWLRGLDGVISVHMPEDKPHLVVVEYNPENVRSKDLLACILGHDLHAELIGL